MKTKKEKSIAAYVSDLKLSVYVLVIMDVRTTSIYNLKTLTSNLCSHEFFLFVFIISPMMATYISQNM